MTPETPSGITADAGTGTDARDLRRSFADRDELIAYVAELYPGAALRDGRVSPVAGGRRAAEERLKAIDPRAYAATRNTIDGKVTGLSPYIRHGVVALAEVRDAALGRVTRRTDATKLVQELAWRDYWQRLYDERGDAIVWEDAEDWKTGFAAEQYAAELPDDLLAGETGLPCMDAFVAELYATGYLHNHARMWLAAYVVHWRGIHWRAGAAWFLRHLLDGDPASNNLSWQWVASTLAPKPYIFNRENLESNTEGRYCRGCPLYGRCDFEGTYAELERELFQRSPARPAARERVGR